MKLSWANNNVRLQCLSQTNIVISQISGCLLKVNIIIQDS